MFFWLPKYLDVVYFSEWSVVCLQVRVFSSARITDLLWSGIFRFLTILENNYQKPLQLFIVLNDLIINGCQFFHLKWRYLQNRIFLFPFFFITNLFLIQVIKVIWCFFNRITRIFFLIMALLVSSVLSLGNVFLTLLCNIMAFKILYS